MQNCVFLRPSRRGNFACAGGKEKSDDVGALVVGFDVARPITSVRCSRLGPRFAAKNLDVQKNYSQPDDRQPTTKSRRSETFRPQQPKKQSKSDQILWQFASAFAFLHPAALNRTPSFSWPQMAGGLVKYRHLSRKSSARQALLRGLVTQLVQYEHIQTTYAKAKETQRLAEKLITLAKRNNEPCRRSAQAWASSSPPSTQLLTARYQTPNLLLPKLFGELRNRYLTREGGYTRVVRTESKNTYDQGESAILEFVDGKKDSRFMMTAKTLARDRLLGRSSTPVTLQNVKKVTKFRDEKELEEMVQRFMILSTEGEGAVEAPSAESAKLAEKEGAAAEVMAGDIVPESAKSGEQVKR
ncbi:uncharacterized protein Triagg1_6127 [Trichoderma aggressivum f. europaeum]|uniref:Ribosomal protein YmL8 n=1 Tax=Trichoderma aggressivum f. europaeum TaxID=173218 RepID=A0AAE1M237_9HYPO|nr:hypothetical protein Triagg1_6127 [Trichoderma aggressivum f. europaeum]